MNEIRREYQYGVNESDLQNLIHEGETTHDVCNIFAVIPVPPHGGIAEERSLLEAAGFSISGTETVDNKLSVVFRRLVRQNVTQRKGKPDGNIYAA